MAYVSFNKSLTSAQIEALTGATAGKLYFSSDYSGIYIIGTDRTAHKVADNFQIKSISANVTVGSIIQYVGPSVAGLVNGRFYKVEQDGWDEIEVQDVSGKADKVSGATNNNVATLGANGNPKDSGVGIADLQEADKNALNQAVMMLLANFAGLPVILNNVEYKFAYTDVENRILFGKKQDNSWYAGDDTDDLLDDVLALYAADDTLFNNIYRLSVALSLARMSGTLSEITNPEWKWVILDSQDKILMGIKQDNTWYLGATINEILDCVLATYTAAGRTQGTYANRPTAPDVGQMYFCIDAATNGKPLWYNGTDWVDATGTVYSV